jgi:hypothetical protein
MVESPFIQWVVLTLFIAVGLAVVFFLPPPKNLWTVEHDGHEWIQWSSGLSVQTIHHPDCGCGVAQSDRQLRY